MDCHYCYRRIDTTEPGWFYVYNNEEVYKAHMECIEIFENTNQAKVMNNEEDIW